MVLSVKIAAGNNYQVMGKYLSKLRLSLSLAETEYFPFDELPDDCKLYIFAFLDVADRVSSAQVCKNWNQLIKRPILWTNVDVTTAVRQPRRSIISRCPSKRESNYLQRVDNYLHFVVDIETMVRRLVFVGDLADAEYSKIFGSFLQNSKCLAELQEVNIDWTKSNVLISAAKDLSLPVDDNHHRRKRLFVRFLEKLVSTAPNITTLTLPFDWSPVAVEALIKLQKLESVVLSRYSDLQGPGASTFDRLISGLPQLRSLSVELWTAFSSGGLTYFPLRSESLEYLDLSQCRGISVSEVCLPRIHVLRLSRHPWSGPLTTPLNISAVPNAPIQCLYHMLCDGAPALKQLNDVVLRPSWRSKPYEELDCVLKSICSCDVHGGSTAISDAFCM